jgi:hypothetical protein
MAKGQAPQVELNSSLSSRNKTKTSAAQNPKASSSNSRVGGTSNSLASGNMPKPLMNPNKLKIGKKKKMRGR